MCKQLLGLVDRISRLIPDIEAAQPRCSLGLQALSQLHTAIAKARELVQNCCTSSKLYLVRKNHYTKKSTSNEIIFCDCNSIYPVRPNMSFFSLNTHKNKIKTIFVFAYVLSDL